MEKIVEQGLLFDFYGELLTEHQRQIYQDAVFENLSLSELAAEYGISRQGVHDLLKRCDNTLQEYESKLQLMAKFRSIKEKTEQLQAAASDASITLEQLKAEVKRKASEILGEL